MELSANKSYDVDFTAIAAGDGLWGMEKGTEVKVNCIAIWIDSNDADGYCCATAYVKHDADADEKGLCYTDTGINDAVNKFISEHDELSKIIEGVEGSEQGMQERFEYNVDVDLTDEVLNDIKGELEKHNYEIKVYA